MNKESRKKNEDDFDKVLDRCSESDFDGHSLFRSFTPSQRLEWLDEARSTMLEIKEGMDRGKEKTPS